VNDRERFVTSLGFGRPDKITLDPGGPRLPTLQVWHQQGLPEGVDWYRYLLESLGIEPPQMRKPFKVRVSFKMEPTFEERTLEHRQGRKLVQDWMGAIVEVSDEYDHTYLRTAKGFVTRKWHKFPVENRQDWEKIKWRYEPDLASRAPEGFDELCTTLANRDYPALMSFNGSFWQLREWCGFEGLCMLMIDDPEFVSEMAAFWTGFVRRMLEMVLTKVELDYAFIKEDMAYKAHSMISPTMVQHFIKPSYDAWVPVIKGSGCPIVCVDSDGFVGELIPIWLESGINCTAPVEVAAHNDIVALRESYGTNLAFTGGIDKRAVATGGERLRNEVLRVVPPLLKKGGTIPCIDHDVPPDISWPNMVEYTKLLAELTGWL
jgi:uroporphyrinogen decarboxylase